MEAGIKVALVDFDHFEMTYALSRCLSKFSKTIEIFTTAAIIDDLQRSSLKTDKKIAWTTTVDVHDFVVKFTRYNEYDFIFLNTVNSHYQELNDLLKKISGPKVILTVHNINFWWQKGTRFKIFKKPRNEEHHQMLSILNQCDAILVLSENIKRYLRKKVSASKIIVFPFSVFEPLSINKQVSDKIEVVIPGAIEKTRKDYAFALKIFVALDKNLFRLKLLGKPKGEYGLAIINECKKLRQQGFDITWFEEYIDIATYEKQMLTADVVFAPIYLNTHHRGIDEVYGKTKETGAVFDLIRYSKPGLFPDNLQVPEPLKKSVMPYKGFDDALEALHKLSDKKYLNTLSLNAEIASEFYSVDKVSGQLLADIRSL